MLVTSEEVLSEAGSEPLVAVEEEIERNIDDDDSYDPNDDFETESEDTPFRGDRCPKYEEYLTCGCQTTCDTMGKSCPAESCTSGCFCKAGKVRSANGLCISQRACPGTKYLMVLFTFLYM